MSVHEINAFKQKFASSVPVGRMGLAEEIAAAVLYLASDESRYVLGFELVVDGQHLDRGRRKHSDRPTGHGRFGRSSTWR